MAENGDMNISANDGCLSQRVSIRSKARPTVIKRNGEILGVYVSRDSKDRVIVRTTLTEVLASISISKIMKSDFHWYEIEVSLPI